jgi:ABC-type sugar transport system substrate-binding protein
MTTSTSSFWRAVAATAALAVLVLVVTACGGGGSSSDGGTEAATTTAEGGTTTAAGGGSGEGGTIVPEPPLEPPTVAELPITKPLKKAAPKQKVAWLACELPDCQGALSKGWHEAGEALGWQIDQINFKSAKPDEGVQQALNEDVDGIGITGVSPALFKAQSKEAIAKEIPIVSASEVTEPEPEENGLYWQGANVRSVKVQAGMIANWAINHSDGKANIAAVTIDSYPILGAEIEGLEEALGECPECGELGVISVTTEDLAEGQVPAKISAYLQSNPDTNYVEFAFSDLSLGVADSLQSLGLDQQVELINVNANPTVLKEVVAGKIAATTLQPQQLIGWIGSDVLARLATGTPLEKYEEEGLVPYWVAEKEQAEEVLDQTEGEWPGPEGFQAKFKELWGG